MPNGPMPTRPGKPVGSPPARTTRNERTSPPLATIAGRVLKRGFAWPKEAVALAASVLTQAPDRADRKA